MRRLKFIVFYGLAFLGMSLSKVDAQQVFKTTSPSVIAYYEYLPSDYAANSNKYPVVIFLHGVGEKGPNTTDVNVLDDYIYKVATHGPPKHVKNGTKFPFILISPQLKNNYGTWPSSYVMEVINHVKKYLRIDERRIYLTGLSLGGGGAWVTAQDYPKLFAAVAPVCGGYNSPSKACNIAGENLPVWAFHGDMDTIVPMLKTVNMVTAINVCLPTPDPLAKLTIYPGVSHNAWDYAYRTDHTLHTPNVYEWMLSKIKTTMANSAVTITSPSNGQTFTAPASVTISTNASVSDGTVSKIEFFNGTTKLGEDATAPYAYTWNNVSAGNYTLVAKVIGSNGASNTSSVDIGVTNAQACAGAGKIEREVWTGITGTGVSSIPVNSTPSSTSELTVFESPVNVGDNYGSRIRGYICVPATGNYTFWIASDDYSELWLSSDENAANKIKIASAPAWTRSRDWSKYASQQSAAISLQAGQKYYIEALHKENYGGDNLAVGWRLPDGTLERPIPGTRLVPFQASENNNPVVSITSPEEGQSFSSPASVNISATASDSDGSVTKVEFYNGTTKLGEDATAPYAYTWNNVSAGNYTLVAKAIDNNGASNTSSVNIVTNAQACAGAGKIEREVWTGITGTSVSSIPVNSTPSSTSELTIFESPVNAGDNYGSRIRGYICVPATGNYTFWIASDDYSELWLSSDENAANKIKIASVSAWTRSREWSKYASQQSAAISLQVGQKYYIEALHKEGYGGDNLAVGWQLPDGTLERPIPGARLSPFESQATTTMGRLLQTTSLGTLEAENLYATQTEDFNTDTEDFNTDIVIFPNPVQSGVPRLTVSGYDGIEERNEANVEIVDIRGQIIYSHKITCEINCNEILIDIGKELTSGVYTVNGTINRKRFSKRLLVR